MVQEQELGQNGQISQGHIKFTDFSLRYRPNTELVLRNLQFQIQAGSKVGVVGRTGAGKSTLGLSLLRLIEAENGSVTIDGQDVSKMNLQSLRDSITTIP